MLIVVIIQKVIYIFGVSLKNRHAMNAFLITSPKGVSEWKSTFVETQEEMNRLEKVGVVSNVTVQQFVNGVLAKSFTYNWNGVQWEK